MSRLPPILPAVCATALVLTSAACASRVAGPAAPPSVIAAPIDVSLLERRVAAHLRFLASDALNGRGSGTRDEWIAATYIGAQLAAVGLDPMGDDGWFVQEVGIQRFRAGAPPVLTAGDRTYARNADFRVGSVPAARVTGTLHRLVPGTPVPAGAAVILPEDAPLTAMSALGAASLVLRKATAPQLATWTQPSAQASEWIATQIIGTPLAPPPGPTVLTLDAATHAAIIAMADGTSVHLKTELIAGDRTRTWNVVGRLPGSDTAASAEVVVLSAHLDHLGARASDATVGSDTIYNGADDDASGVVAVMELARVLAAGPRPRRPIVFALFGSEESGGFGARYFVDRPVVPLSDIVADLQVEMIGRPDPTVPAGTLWLTGYDRSTLGPQLAARGARLVADPHPDQRFFERSDNIRFARRGVVAHTVSSFGLHREYHQPSDEFAHINVVHMRDAIASLVEPVRWLATTTDKPAWREGRQP